MDELPVGFAMALAENESAMRHFAGLSDDIRRQITVQARQAGSREEMQAIVQSLA